MNESSVNGRFTGGYFFYWVYTGSRNMSKPIVNRKIMLQEISGGQSGYSGGVPVPGDENFQVWDAAEN